MRLRIRQNHRRPKGFMLMELLAALVLISIAVTAFLAGLGQCAKAAAKSEEIASAASSLETLLFQLETGERPDLAHYGGKVNTGHFELLVSSAERKDFADFTSYTITTDVRRTGGHGVLHLETYLGERFSP